MQQLALLLSGGLLVCGILASSTATVSPLYAQENFQENEGWPELPLLELQINGKFWQLLSWQELSALTELRRAGVSVERVVPLAFLFPDFRKVESIDSRNLRGKFLEINGQSLERSYLKLGQNGGLALHLKGNASRAQSQPLQINIYGEVWPQKTLRLWLEEDLEHPFLFAQLETYQRFHNLQIEVEVVGDLELAASLSLQHNEANLPDMILASRRRTQMLRNLLQEQPIVEGRSLAFVKLFEINAKYGSVSLYYSAPLALETYSLLYNSKLLEGEMQSAHRNLSSLFDRLAELKESQGTGAKNTPYALGIGSDTLPFTLLLHSFLPAVKDDNSINIADLRFGLEYLRKQGRKGLLRQLDFAEERFAQGEIAAIIARSGKLPKILQLSALQQEHIQIAAMPFNDLNDREIMSYPKIWSLSILRKSPVQPQAIGLRRYLLRGAVQGQFDLSRGLLPVNTVHYPFYQRSLYYPLLPKAQRLYAMDAKQLWEYGIEQRGLFQQIEDFDRLFRDRIKLLLDSNINIADLLADMQRQQIQKVVARPEFLFLR